MEVLPIALGAVQLLTILSGAAAFIDSIVGPGLANCTFEVDRCEWRPYDTTYNHPMQWIITDDTATFPPPPTGSWFAAVEMGNIHNLTMNATLMNALFKLDGIEEIITTFNYIFWFDERDSNARAKLSLKYQMAVGGPPDSPYILELWNVATSRGVKWNTATVSYKPGREWISKFWFLAEVFNTNRVKFAIDDFYVKVIKKPAIPPRRHHLTNDD